MASARVQMRLEKMARGFEALQKRGYFSAAEVSEFMKARRRHEFRLVAFDVHPEDYLAYLQYDMELEALRRARREERHFRGSDGASPADDGILHNIHVTFTRMSIRYGPDERVWAQWLDWLLRCRDLPRLRATFARGLLRHPAVAALWVAAAAFELEYRANALLARSLLQRGLRLLPRSPRMWLEYFRFELIYAQLLRSNARLSSKPAAGDVRPDEDLEGYYALESFCSLLPPAAPPSAAAAPSSAAAAPSSVCKSISFVSVVEDDEDDDAVDPASASTLRPSPIGVNLARVWLRSDAETAVAALEVLRPVVVAAEWPDVEAFILAHAAALDAWISEHRRSMREARELRRLASPGGDAASPDAIFEAANGAADPAAADLSRIPLMIFEAALEELPAVSSVLLEFAEVASAFDDVEALLMRMHSLAAGRVSDAHRVVDVIARQHVRFGGVMPEHLTPDYVARCEARACGVYEAEIGRRRDHPLVAHYVEFLASRIAAAPDAAAAAACERRLAAVVDGGYQLDDASWLSWAAAAQRAGTLRPWLRQLSDARDARYLASATLQTLARRLNVQLLLEAESNAFGLIAAPAPAADCAPFFVVPVDATSPPLLWETWLAELAALAPTSARFGELLERVDSALLHCPAAVTASFEALAAYAYAAGDVDALRSLYRRLLHSSAFTRDVYAAAVRLEAAALPSQPSSPLVAELHRAASKLVAC
jgi:hypothetical protein